MFRNCLFPCRAVFNKKFRSMVLFCQLVADQESYRPVTELLLLNRLWHIAYPYIDATMKHGPESNFESQCNVDQLNLQLSKWFVVLISKHHQINYTVPRKKSLKHGLWTFVLRKSAYILPAQCLVGRCSSSRWRGSNAEWRYEILNFADPAAY